MNLKRQSQLVDEIYSEKINILLTGSANYWLAFPFILSLKLKDKGTPDHQVLILKKKYVTLLELTAI